MKRFIAFVASSLLASGVSAQNVGIGTNTPDASAKLHVVDANRGILISNVVLTDVTVAAPVTAPATGLLVWNTNATVTGGSGAGYYYWDGTQWVRLMTSANADDWQLLGNAGTNPTTNFVGTTDAQDLVFRTNNVENMRINIDGNVGIGTTSNAARLYTNLPNTDATTNYGIYNYFDGADAGTTYGIRTHNYGSTNSTKYGIYNNVNNEGTGNHYGIYNLVYMNSASNGTGYGAYNYLSAYGSGNHRALYNYLNLNGTVASANNYASYNYMNVSTSSNTSTIHGEFTLVDYNAGVRYGEYKDMSTHPSYAGTVYADYNFIDGTGNDLIYGVYADITNTGTGTHYGIYSDVPGGTNDFAAYFNSGNVVANEIGGTYYYRIESDNRPNMLYVDGTDDIVRIGNDLTGDFGNGGTVSGVVVDYVVDFDNGVGATGTAIGVGSVEYILDLSSETAINNRFSPSVDNVYDLGSATLRWDDVYATNGTIVTSDEREKEQIQPMKYGLAEVMKLQPVTYKWKRSTVGSTQMTEDQKELKLGLIAQDVQKVLPEVVQTHDWRPVSEETPDQYHLVENDRLGMSYHEIVPVLIKATQEQQEIIETQNDKIEKLEKELEEIKRLLQAE